MHNDDVSIARRLQYLTIYVSSSTSYLPNVLMREKWHVHICILWLVVEAGLHHKLYSGSLCSTGMVARTTTVLIRGVRLCASNEGILQYPEPVAKQYYLLLEYTSRTRGRSTPALSIMKDIAWASATDRWLGKNLTVSTVVRYTAYSYSQSLRDVQTSSSAAQ